MKKILLSLITLILLLPVIGQASVSFDGVNDYVDVGSAQLIDTDAPWTVSVWINIDSYAVNAYPGIAMFATDVGQGLKIFANSNDAGFRPITFGTSGVGTVK